MNLKNDNVIAFYRKRLDEAYKEFIDRWHQDIHTPEKEDAKDLSTLQPKNRST